MKNMKLLKLSYCNGKNTELFKIDPSLGPSAPEIDRIIIEYAEKYGCGLDSIHTVYFSESGGIIFERKPKPAKRIIFLNTSILTAYGVYTYRPSSVEDVKKIIWDAQDFGYEMISAIGHQSTADVLNEIVGRQAGVEIPVNRINYKFEEKDICVVFKLRGRPPEGKILTIEEISAIGFDFGIIKSLYS